MTRGDAERHPRFHFSVRFRRQEFHRWSREFVIVGALALRRDLDPPVGTLFAFLHGWKIELRVRLESVGEIPPKDELVIMLVR